MSFDNSTPREQLIQELAEVRTQLAAKEQQCKELSQELTLLKSKKLPESERLVRNACRKLTARKQAEEALRRLSEFPEKNPNPVLRVAADGALLYANAPARNWLATLGWQSDGPLPAAMLAIAADAHGKAHAVEAETSYPGGTTFWVSAVQPSGEDYINLYSIDITERKQAEVALRENEKRWAVTLASIGDAVIATDTDGRITFLNKVAELLTGWGMADAAGKPVQEVFHIVNEHTRAIVEDPVSKVIQTGMIVGLANHTVLLRKGGGEMPIDDSGAPIRDEEGRILGVVLTFRDITERKKAEESLRESEQGVRRKLDSVLSPEGDLGVLELGDLIDTSALQKLMDDFHAVARIPMSILNVKGRVLVGVGWQDICTRFHRVQPDTCRNCLESDTRLSAGLTQGEHRLYKCRNNLWDMATPIIVAGQHVGNIFTGQFFFKDETVDRELFRAQARKYGFGEEEYLSALDRVPRLSRETVDRGMSFFLKLSDTLSQLGYSNVKLSRLLAERDRLNDSLQESRGKLEAAMGSMTDAVSISDAQGRFLDFNDAFATFHKFKNKDECPKTFTEYHDILDVFMANGELAPLDQWAAPRALRGESVTNAEYTLRRKDTDETWVGSYSFGPIRDKDGLIVGSVVVGRDITERKRAEQAIEKSERRFRALTEKAGELITVLDATGIITYNLAGANSTLGYTAEELVGRNAFDLVHPDDLPRIANLFQEGVPQLGKVEHAELRIRAKDGSWRWQFAVGTNLLCEPAVGGILINSRDITERKQAEESLRESESFYRQTLESIPGMVFTTRPDGYCDYQSQQWVDYTGVPLSEHLGDGWNQLLHPDDRSRAFEVWRSAVEGLALYDLEYRVRRHDGAYEWFRVIGRPIRDASGEIVRWFGVAMNIEDLKQVEQALRQLNETLEQRVAQRTELAEGRAKQLQALSMELIEVEEQERQRIAELLHDDLQQVLAAARMQLEAACETIPREPMLEGVGQLLVESIRKSRRLSHELSPAVLHHSGLVAAMQWLARQMKDQFGLQVQLESDGVHELESSPLRVFLFRAVQELLFNVVKHAGVKTAQVVLSSSGNSLAMTVSDQGQGFSPDILDSYTEPRGFGLLSIRERARYIGGNLVVESAPGKGSRFALTVPISKDRVDEVERPAVDQQPLTQAGSPVSTSMRGLRVLFVDDHAIMRQGLIRLMAGQPNIQVVGEAANGREAIERVRQLKPDVVVMDISMPEMNGIEATRGIKAEFPEVRVIGLSMYEEEQFACSMREAGAEAFVSKTASPAVLLEAIYGFDR